jgi:hypothetical protein
MRTTDEVSNSIASFNDFVKSIRDVNAQRRISKDQLARDINATHYGPGGAVDRLATMQYGPGGSVDRTATMQYGPGGAYDRHNISTENVARMQQPVWNSEADLKKAQARGANYTTDLTSWIAGLKDTEGNSLLGRQKGIEFNILRSANPSFAGSSVATPSDVISDVWSKEAFKQPYNRVAQPEQGWGVSPINPMNWARGIRRSFSGSPIAVPSY